MVTTIQPTAITEAYLYLQSKIGGNITLSDDYILNLKRIYYDTHKSNDMYFYLLFILPLIFFNYFNEINLQTLSKDFNKFGIFAIFSFGILYIFACYYLTVPSDDNKNTQIIKELIYPLSVIIGIFIYSIIKSTQDKGMHILFSLILIIPAIIIIILNVSLSNITYILNIVLILVSIIIVLIYIFVFNKKTGLSQFSNFYSLIFWVIAFLLIGRIFNVINKIIINYNSSNYLLEKNTDTSTVLNNNITKRLNTIITNLNLDITTTELYNLLITYKLTDTTNNYSSSIYYIISSGLNLLFYWLFGSTINYNTNVETKNVNQLAFPILGFNFPNQTNFIEKIYANLIGIISTKIFVNGFSNNGSLSINIFNIFLTGLKFMLIIPLGKKYNKWYEYIVDIKNNKYIRYLLRGLYAGLDIKTSENKLEKNIKNNIVDKNLFFEGNDMGVYMILYFLLGIGISTFSGMDYLTNIPLTSFILTCSKYISVIIILIFYLR